MPDPREFADVVHLNRIYTRSGDDGTTGQGDGARVSKLHPRIIAGGAVDEINCSIGAAMASDPNSRIAGTARRLQQFLFDLGADLCVPLPAEGPDSCPCRVTSEHVRTLELLIDELTDQLQPLNSFVLPGGMPMAAGLHLARAVCRRAELDVLRLHLAEPINPLIPVALNRLSDLLFVLARMANDTGRKDVLWQPGSGL